MDRSLSSGRNAMGSQITILIRWIVIYPMDSAIQRLNNRGQELISVVRDTGGVKGGRG